MHDPNADPLGGMRAARFLFRLTALSDTILPPYLGSTLRGGFGQAFRASSCANPGAAGCGGCLLHRVCAYSYCFASTVPPESEVLRNLDEIPRPFAIEPPAAEKTELAPGGSLDFGLVLIGRAIEYFPYFLLSIQRLGETGMGKGRLHGQGRFEVAGVFGLGPWSDEPGGAVYTRESGRVRAEAIRIIDSSAVSSRLDAPQFNIQNSKLKIAFLTMTRLKSDRDYARRPEFHVLLRALLRRISALSYFHCGRRIEADFPGLAARSRAVALARDATQWRDWTRFSSRQDARMDFGGLVGEAEYEGDLAEFLPWLLWGQIVHVGKNATFGLGRIEVAGRGS